ncbi:MAG: DUF6713 family protein [Patescibacteria group bacterium]
MLEIFIFNAILLILHEIESAYEKEWEILKLPGKLTGFILLHIPILFLIFYGLLEIEKQTQVGNVIGIILGIGGIIPFLVHRIFFNRKDHFHSVISNILIYANIVTGIIVIILSIV